MNLQPRGWRASVAALAAALLIPLTGLPAAASPNDALVVRTEGHVDSPHVTWDEHTSNFQLVSRSGGDLPIEKTVNYAGRGKENKGQFVFTVPDDPRLSFLGKPGTRLYSLGPAAGGRGAPIWAGFGADLDLPVDSFRDGTLTMEIVDFDGPGRMELFNYTDADYPVRRLWSSHDLGYRSTWATAGTHTHNLTTFSKPGRYQVTYRAAARGVDGKLIASAPQTLFWQIGGTRPDEHGLGPIEDAFAASAQSSDSEQFHPEFSLRPYHGSMPGSADGALSTLTFNTGNDRDRGHAVFYVDGYFLAEVPVESGTAHWDELLGDTESSYSAVFIPDKAAESPRWVSAPLRYTTGEQTTATTDEADGLPSPATQDPAPRLDLGDYQPTSTDITVSTTAEDPDTATTDLTVAPADDSLSVLASGGYYRLDSSGTISADVVGTQAASCPIAFSSAPGRRTSRQSIDGCQGPGYALVLKISPDARTIAPGDAHVTVALPDGFAPTPPTTVAFQLNNEPEDPDYSPEDPEGTDNTEGATLSTQPVTLEQGHLDIAPFSRGSEVDLAIKDGTGTASHQEVWRDPSAVTLSVADQAQRTLSARDVAKGLGFLGQEGQQIYLLPQSQTDGLLWPGLSTEDDAATHDGDYTFTITSAETPEGGDWFAFTGGGPTPIEHVFDATHSQLRADAPLHRHLAWAFTKPGTYRLSATIARGGDNPATSKPVTLTWQVGQSEQDQPDREAGTAQERWTTGHIDIHPADVPGSPTTPELLLHRDGTGDRKTSDVALVVNAARARVIGGGQRYPSIPVEPELAFLGKRGDVVYHLPMSQDPQAIWPGFDTYSVRTTHPDMRFRLRPKSAPEGGKWFAFTSGLDIHRIADSTGPAVFGSGKPFHAHLDWVFTRSGTYEIEVRGESSTGSTAWHTVTFVVEPHTFGQVKLDS